MDKKTDLTLRVDCTLVSIDDFSSYKRDLDDEKLFNRVVKTLLNIPWAPGSVPVHTKEIFPRWILDAAAAAVCRRRSEPWYIDIDWDEGT